MKKTAILLIVLTIVSKLLGFGREIALAYFYGTSVISDAYIIALTIPTTIFAFIGSSITTVYIPMYTNILKAKNEIKANKFTSNLINIILFICTIVIVLSFIYAENIVKIFASGFDGEILRITIELTKISIISIYFTSLVHLLSAFLQIKGNYVIPALVAFPLNLIIIASIILSYEAEVEILALGIIVGALGQLLLLLPFVFRNNFKYRPILRLNDTNIRKMMYLALPVILGVAVNDINTIIDKTIASSILVGGISSLNYAQRLNGFVQGIIVLSIGTAMYPLLSSLAIDKRTSELKKVFSESIIGTSLLVLPCTVGAMVLSKEIIEILFARGAFENEAILVTSSALFFYAIGMIGVGLRHITSRLFYALEDTKTPVINATIGMIMNIILNIVLSKYMGISGLALATSISALLTATLMFVSLHKKIGRFGMKNIATANLKILLSSTIMGIFVKITNVYFLNHSDIKISLFLSIGIGVILYIILIYFMRIKEVDNVVRVLKKKYKEG